MAGEKKVEFLEKTLCSLEKTHRLGQVTSRKESHVETRPLSPFAMGQTAVQDGTVPTLRDNTRHTPWVAAGT